MSNSLQPHGLQHPPLPRHLLSPRVCPNACLSGAISHALRSSQKHSGHFLTWRAHSQVSYLLPFHTVHGVLAARIRGWGATSSSSGPHLVGAPHCGLSVLGGPAQHGSQLHRVTKASSPQQGCDPRRGPGRKQAPFRAGEGGSPN